MKFGFSIVALAAIVLSATNGVDAAMRGTLTRNGGDIMEIKREQRGLKKNGGGGGGNNGGVNTKDGCEVFKKQMIPIELKCQSNQECLDQGLGYLGCVNYSANFCALVDPAECNDTLHFMGDDEFKLEHDYKYEKPEDAVASSVFGGAGDVVDIQTEDVDIKVYQNKDGDEVVQISSLNSNNNDVQTATVHQHNEPAKHTVASHHQQQQTEPVKHAATASSHKVHHETASYKDLTGLSNIDPLYYPAEQEVHHETRILHG